MYANYFICSQIHFLFHTFNSFLLSLIFIIVLYCIYCIICLCLPEWQINFIIIIIIIVSQNYY